MTSYIYQDRRMVKVTDTVVTEDVELHTPVCNTLVVQNAATATTFAAVTGTVSIAPGTTLTAHGPVPGTVRVRDGGKAAFHGNG